MGNTEVKVKNPFEVNLDCIHCGLCLPRCPTYQQLGSEADSPRGRIYLMKAVEKGRLTLDATVLDHIECCLGCRACETACPSGVRYELMLNETRARIFQQQPPGLPTRFALKRLIPYPKRLKILAGCFRFYQRSGLRHVARRLLPLFSVKLAEAERKLPDVPAPNPMKASYPSRGPRRHRVGFLNGCVMPILFPQVHRASIRLLQAAGCEVVLPPGQSCCGALHSHAGDRHGARSLALALIDVFRDENLDAIIVNSAGCGAAMKEFPHLFDEPGLQERAREFESRVKDISEFLDEAHVDLRFRSLPIRVAYDDPCHLLHGQQIARQPRRLLGGIPGLTLLEVPNSDRCCGSAGIYNLIRPEMSGRLLERKIDELLSTKPERIATGNPGCLLQIRYGLEKRGISIPVQHPVELLSAALEDSDP